jgi:hypothetical protein
MILYALGSEPPSTMKTLKASPLALWERVRERDHVLGRTTIASSLKKPT